MQSKKHSMIESLANVVIGYTVAIFSQLLIFPLFGLDVPIEHNLMMGLMFTVISLIRSYVLRRVFNFHTSGSADK